MQDNVLGISDVLLKYPDDVFITLTDDPANTVAPKFNYSKSSQEGEARLLHHYTDKSYTRHTLIKSVSVQQIDEAVPLTLWYKTVILFQYFLALSIHARGMDGFIKDKLYMQKFELTRYTECITKLFNHAKFGNLATVKCFTHLLESVFNRIIDNVSGNGLTNVQFGIGGESSGYRISSSFIKEVSQPKLLKSIRKYNTAVSTMVHMAVGNNTFQLELDKTLTRLFSEMVSYTSRESVNRTITSTDTPDPKRVEIKADGKMTHTMSPVDMGHTFDISGPETKTFLAALLEGVSNNISTHFVEEGKMYYFVYQYSPEGQYLDTESVDAVMSHGATIKSYNTFLESIVPDDTSVVSDVNIGHQTMMSIIPSVYESLTKDPVCMLSGIGLIVCLTKEKSYNNTHTRITYDMVKDIMLTTDTSIDTNDDPIVMHSNLPPMSKGSETLPGMVNRIEDGWSIQSEKDSITLLGDVAPKANIINNVPKRYRNIDKNTVNLLAVIVDFMDVPSMGLIVFDADETYTLFDMLSDIINGDDISRIVTSSFLAPVNILHSIKTFLIHSSQYHD